MKRSALILFWSLVTLASLVLTSQDLAFLVTDWVGGVMVGRCLTDGRV